MSTLQKAKKSIYKIKLKLVSANKKVFSTYQILPNLSFIKNSTISIPDILRIKPLIICMSILVGQIKKFNLPVNAEIMILILLLKSIKALIILASSF